MKNIVYIIIYAVLIFILVFYTILKKCSVKEKSLLIKEKLIIPSLLIVLLTCLLFIVIPKDEQDYSKVIVDGVIYELISEENYEKYYDYETIDEDIKVYNSYYFDMINPSLYPKISDETIDCYNYLFYSYPFDYYIITPYSNYNSKTYCVTGYTDDLVEDVVIEEMINGVKVTDVGYNAFNKASMKSITANFYLTYHPYSISECDNLEYITITTGCLLPLSFSNLENIDCFDLSNDNYLRPIHLFDASLYKITANKLELPQLEITYNMSNIGVRTFSNISLKYPLIHDCEILNLVTSQIYQEGYSYYKELIWEDNILYTGYDELESIVYIGKNSDTIVVPVIDIFDSNYLETYKLYIDNEKIVWEYFNILTENNDQVNIYLNITTDINKFEIIDNKLMVSIKIEEDSYETYELLDLSTGNFVIKYINYEIN